MFTFQLIAWGSHFFKGFALTVALNYFATLDSRVRLTHIRVKNCLPRTGTAAAPLHPLLWLRRFTFPWGQFNSSASTPRSRRVHRKIHRTARPWSFRRLEYRSYIRNHVWSSSRLLGEFELTPLEYPPADVSFILNYFVLQQNAIFFNRSCENSTPI